MRTVNFWSNGRTYKEINQCGPYFLVKWSCIKERINERGPYNFVEWS